MSWGNSDGIKGRCDAKCHGAKEPKCECMCGGAFHGAAHRPGGLDKALKDYWEPVLEQAKERAEREGVQLEFFGLQLGFGFLAEGSGGWMESGRTPAALPSDDPSGSPIRGPPYLSEYLLIRALAYIITEP
jgi:hypothetical protein